MFQQYITQNLVSFYLILSPLQKNIINVQNYCIIPSYFELYSKKINIFKWNIPQSKIISWIFPFFVAFEQIHNINSSVLAIVRT